MSDERRTWLRQQWEEHIDAVEGERENLLDIIRGIVRAQRDLSLALSFANQIVEQYGTGEEDDG